MQSTQIWSPEQPRLPITSQASPGSSWPFKQVRSGVAVGVGVGVSVGVGVAVGVAVAVAVGVAVGVGSSDGLGPADGSELGDALGSDALANPAGMLVAARRARTSTTIGRRNGDRPTMARGG